MTTLTELRIPLDTINIGGRILRAKALDAVGHRSDDPVPDKLMNKFLGELERLEFDWLEKRGAPVITRVTQFGTLDPRGPGYGWNTLQIDDGWVGGRWADSPEYAALCFATGHGDRSRKVQWVVADHDFIVSNRYQDALRRKSDRRMFEVTNSPVESPVQVREDRQCAAATSDPFALFDSDWLEAAS